MRPKRGQDVDTRLSQLINSPVWTATIIPFGLLQLFLLQLFDSVRQEQPQALGKVIPIYGDVTEPELGISPADQKVLIDNVGSLTRLCSSPINTK
jgi:hypothetical protein